MATFLNANLWPTSIAALRVTVTAMTWTVVPAGMSDFAIATLSPGASTSTRGSVFIAILSIYELSIKTNAFTAEDAEDAEEEKIHKCA